MNTLTHEHVKKTTASLFSGIEGFGLAAEQHGYTTKFWCEIEPFNQRILKYHFPKATGYDNIKTTDFTIWKHRIDVLTGGFPCQPFSAAGQRKGADDNRFLWPQTARALREIQPTWAIFENVAGLQSMAYPSEFEKSVQSGVGNNTNLYAQESTLHYTEEEWGILNGILEEIKAEGYAVQTFCIPACGKEAYHRRYRLWIVAHRNSSTTKLEKYRHRGQKRQQTQNYQRALVRQKYRSFGAKRLRGCICDGDVADNNVKCLERRTKIKRKRGECIGKGRKVWGKTRTVSNSRNAPHPNHQRTHQHMRDQRARTTKSKTGPTWQYVSQSRQGHRPSDDANATIHRRTPCRASGSPQSHGRSDDGKSQQWRKSSQRTHRLATFSRNVANHTSARGRQNNRLGKPRQHDQTSTTLANPRAFPSFSPICGRNDGLSELLDGITFSAWRRGSIKAFGNAIYPQVAQTLFETIRKVEAQEKAQRGLVHPHTIFIR